MKVIIAGSRTATDYACICEAITKSGFVITEVVCGMAPGVDALGARYAREHHIPVKEFYPNWKRYGRAAGPMRNVAMARYADALIAVWDTTSKGTASMLRYAHKQQLAIYLQYREHI